MLVVDATIVVVSLPSIGKGLHFSEETLQWIVTGYGITFGGFLMVGGRCADLWGRRRVLLIGLLVFMAASLASALAESQVTLILARLAQGLGSALASPAALALLSSTFAEGHERNKALGIWSAIAGFGATSGNVFGGVITVELGWRWIFLINLPIGCVAITALLVLVPRSAGMRHEPVDAPGAITVTAGGALLIFALGEIEARGLASIQALLPLFGAVVMLTLFYVIEEHTRRPLLRLRLLPRSSVFGCTLAGLANIVSIGPYVFMSLFMQQTLHFSPIVAGVAFVPWAAIIGISSALTSRHISRLGARYTASFGFGFFAVGVAPLTFLSARSGYLGGLLPWFVLLGVGGGMSQVSSTVLALSGVPEGEHGMAAGLVNSAQRMGSAVGLSLLVTVAATWTTHLRHVGASEGAATLAGYNFALRLACAIALIGAVLSVAAVTMQRRRALLPAPEATAQNGTRAARIITALEPGTESD